MVQGGGGLPASAGEGRPPSLRAASVVAGARPGSRRGAWCLAECLTSIDPGQNIGPGAGAQGLGRTVRTLARLGSSVNAKDYRCVRAFQILVK